MIRDPLYKQIARALAEGPLDALAFERCAQDLLETAYPGLAPIVGGSDGGMDGAVPDGDLPAIPLIVSTAENLTANLRKNFRRYKTKGGTRNKVVFATSRPLTPQKLQNLKRVAHEEGFELVNIHDNDYFTQRLYRHSEWRLELLAISGHPPALSPFPRDARPHVDLESVGRHTEIKWLHEQDGDRLLVGQPGSGKTFLFQKAAITKNWLFVVDSEPTSIADHLRELSPDGLIVEDAHTREDLLRRLVGLRRELGKDFAIVADSWPSGTDRIRGLLSLPTAAMCRLPRLGRPSLVVIVDKIFASAGLAPHSWLVNELVDQAAGRPGLASTLAYLCVKGSVDDILSGEALRIQLISPLVDLIGQKGVDVLATFALGGRAGLRMHDVAKALGQAPLDVRDIVTTIGSGGVVLEHDTTISIQPQRLREVLVAKTFFSGGAKLPCNDALRASVSAESTALTLIGAKVVGGDVPDKLLRQFVRSRPSGKVLMHYAGLGTEEAQWALHNFSPHAPQLASSVLRTAPRAAIPHLLDGELTDNQPLRSPLVHPYQIIKEWVMEIRSGEGEPFERRHELIQGLIHWKNTGGEILLVLRVLSLALCPGFSTRTRNVEDRASFSITWGLLSRQDLHRVSTLWPAVRQLLPYHPQIPWNSFQDVWLNWIQPNRVAADFPVDVADHMKSVGSQILRDLIARFPDDRVLHALVRQLTLRHDLHIPVLAEDSEFDVFVANRFASSDYVTTYEGLQRKARLIGTRWSNGTSENIAKRLARCEHDMFRGGFHDRILYGVACQELADAVKAPYAWAEALLEADVDPATIFPFLERTVGEADRSASQLLAKCFQRRKYRLIAARVVFSSANSDTPIEEALTIMGDYAEDVQRWCIDGTIDHRFFPQLLSHDSERVASATAIGIWLATPEGFPQSVRNACYDALLSCDASELVHMFPKEPTLAKMWLREQGEHQSFGSATFDEIARAAVAGLTTGERQELLSDFEGSRPDSNAIQILVGDSADIYRVLLGQEDLREFHLVPLLDPAFARWLRDLGSKRGPPSPAWVSLALCALDAGYSPQRIFQASINQVAWKGLESDCWVSLAARYEPLGTHEDPRIRELACIASEESRDRRKQASGWEQG